jgi:hypothetical protein
VRTEQSVWVQCLRCGHVGTAETLSRLSLAPSTPIPLLSSDCRRVRKSECEGDAQACAATAKGVLMRGSP